MARPAKIATASEYDEPSVPSPAVDDDVERVADDGDTVDDDADDSEEKD